MIRKLFLILNCWLLVTGHMQAQSITLEECYRLAESNYPLVRQYALIEKTEAYSISNASKGNLPQMQIGGQATYQSDVTQIPVSLPNIAVPAMSRDQYKLYGEVLQPITDLLTVKRQKELIDANTRVEEQKIEVELYKLKERINQLYFGILLMDGQAAQVEILKKDIQSGIDKNSVAIANGTALKSSADQLKAELLKAEQRTVELKAARKGYGDVLALFIGRDIDQHTLLEKPLPAISIPDINRPELELFDRQKQAFDAQNKLVDTNILPRLSLFLQGGYGRPALNMLNNNFDFYYIGGIRLAWNIAGFYTHKKEKQLLSLRQDAVDVQRELFLFNTNLALKQQNSEISKIKELIESDRKIIQLREKVKFSAQNQLENGTVTVNDYLTHINAEDQAKLNLILHEIELLMAQYNFKTTAGNW